MSRWLVAALLVAALLAGCSGRQSLPLQPSLEGWQEMRTERLVLIGDVSIPDLVRIADELDLFEAVLARTAVVPERRLPVPTRIFVFRSPAMFRQFASNPLIVGQMTSEPDGYTAGFGFSRQGYLARGVLFHEYTHVLLKGTHQFDYPRWYEEGIAEYLSTLRQQGNAVSIGASPGERLSWLMENGLLPLGQLLEPAAEVGVLGYYATAWAVVHYLLGAQETRTQLQEFVDRLTRGTAAIAAFEETFERSTSELDRAVDAHVSHLARGGRFELVFDAATLPSERQWESRTLEAGEAAYRLAEFARAMDDGDEVSDLTKSLFDLAARQVPTQPRALASRAWTRALDGKFEAATLEVESALRESPDGLEVLLFAAAVYQLAAASAPDPRAANQRARSLYERAAAVDPASRRARAALGRHYLGSADPAHAERAVGELEAALRTGTWDPQLELDLSRAYLRSGSQLAARRTLERLVVLPHRREIADEAQRLLNDLQDLRSPGAE